MKMTEITGSSSIKAVRHYGGRLRITFTSGKTYDYFGVPPETYAELLAADSMGAYFARVIRQHFDAKIVDLAAEAADPELFTKEEAPAPDVIGFGDLEDPAEWPDEPPEDVA